MINLALQPINQLFIAGIVKPENEVQRTGELEIVKTPRPENVPEQRDSIEIVGAEKINVQSALQEEIFSFKIKKICLTEIIFENSFRDCNFKKIIINYDNIENQLTDKFPRILSVQKNKTSSNLIAINH